MQLRVPCEKLEIFSFTSSIMKNINPFLFRKTLCNCLCSSSSTNSCDSASFFWNTEEFGAKNYFTHHSTADTQFYNTQFYKHTTVIRIRKHLNNFPFLSKRYKAIAVCWCKQPTSKSVQMCLYCMYLLKLYEKIIIILLTNVLVNIGSEIRKIQFILWMVYTYNAKGLEKVEKMGRG